MFFFSAFFVILLAGILMILWEFDHATRMHLDRRNTRAKPKESGIIGDATSKPA